MCPDQVTCHSGLGTFLQLSKTMHLTIRCCIFLCILFLQVYKGAMDLASISIFGLQQARTAVNASRKPSFNSRQQGRQWQQGEPTFLLDQVIHLAKVRWRWVGGSMAAVPLNILL